MPIRFELYDFPDSLEKKWRPHLPVMPPALRLHYCWEQCHTLMTPLSYMPIGSKNGTCHMCKKKSALVRVECSCANCGRVAVVISPVTDKLLVAYTTKSSVDAVEAVRHGRIYISTPNRFVCGPCNAANTLSFATCQKCHFPKTPLSLEEEQLFVDIDYHTKFCERCGPERLKIKVPMISARSVERIRLRLGG